MNLDMNLSRRNHLKLQEILDTSIVVAPACHTRITDRIAALTYVHIFNNAYYLLRLPFLTSKTQETAFQIINRTV
jgi:hypothetical protein